MSIEVIKHRDFDWEPASVFVHVPSGVAIDEKRVSVALTDWLKARHTPCACHLAYLRIEVVSESILAIHCEWLCDKCLDPFIGRLTSIVPMAREVHLGSVEVPSRPVLPSLQKTGDPIYVESQSVELESGETVEVNSFEISRFPVTVQEYRDAAQAAGLSTLAELSGDYENCYQSNSTLHVLSEEEISQCPARCVSFHDASAYCAHVNARLPTEVEWLAAAIIEKGEISGLEYRNRISSICKSPLALQYTGIEITATTEGVHHCVARRGPVGIKQQKWRQQVQGNRLIVPKNYYDCMMSFRVVRS